MILRINLLQYSQNSVTADGSLLSPTGGVNTIPPIQQNTHENNGYGIWLWETSAMNYSITSKTGTTRTTTSRTTSTTPMTTLTQCTCTSTVAWRTCTESARIAHLPQPVMITLAHSWLKFWAHFTSIHGHPHGALSFIRLLRFLLLPLPPVCPRLPLPPRAVPWALPHEGHGKPAPLRDEREWGHFWRLPLLYSRRSEIILRYSRILHLLSSYWTESSTYVPREESFLISQYLHYWKKLSREEIYDARGGQEKSQNIWGKNKFNCLDIAGKDGILYIITTLRKNSFRWKDPEEALHLIPFEGESKHMLSRLAAQRICETKILQVTQKVRGVWDTLKCEPGKKEVWNPNVVLISELRESRVTYGSKDSGDLSLRDACFGKPRSTNKNIFHPKQCWFQLQRRQWKRNERRS